MDAQDSPEDNRQRLCLKLFNNSRTHAATRYMSHTDDWCVYIVAIT